MDLDSHVSVKLRSSLADCLDDRTASVVPLCKETIVPCPVPGCPDSVARKALNAHVADPQHVLQLCIMVMGQEARLESQERRLLAQADEIQSLKALLKRR